MMTVVLFVVENYSIQCSAIVISLVSMEWSFDVAAATCCLG